MKPLKKPIDSNFIIRILNLHCFLHIFRILNLKDASEGFSKPRFQLFRPLKKIYESKQSNSLFFNLVFTFQNQIIVGGIITIIGASLNLLVPQLIRSFMHFMDRQNLSKHQIQSADEFLYKFIVIQTLRLFFAQHSKRLFHELAIKVQSTLARKLVSKSLRIARQCRDRIPESQIIQLQNVDLKLIFTLFKNMHLYFQAPFTIIVALIMLFVQSKRYGFIGVYWFLIAFLLQRQLDGRMTHCNATKLGLIQKRSNINYELLQKIKQAKIIGYQDLLVQKNNDLFIEENHDHQLFYKYTTLYDITLLVLPIFVVVTITLYDMNEVNPITVQQVYLMLSLLGTCYNPMKSVRVISISMHDGLHSLKRLSQYFHLPQQTKSQLIDNNIEVGQVMIKKGTRAAYPHSNYTFQIRVGFHIEIKKGQRLIVLSRRGHGSSSFLQMLIGNMKKMKGSVFINGNIAYLPQKDFFIKETVEENIKFYNKNVDSLKATKIYGDLGLHRDLNYTKGLNEVMDDINKFTPSTLQKIALARLLVSNADILILDCPYSKIDKQTAIVVQRILRDKQEQGVTVIIAEKSLQFSDDADKIVILNEGYTEQYGTFQQLTKTVHSKITKFFKFKEDQIKDISQTHSVSIGARFKKRFQKLAQQVQSNSSSHHGKKSLLKLFMAAPFAQNVVSLARKVRQDQMKYEQNFIKYVKKFFTSISFFQTIYLLIIILSAQLLHIFIHYYIGHLQEDHGDEGYQNYKNMLMLQVLLTFCLAGIIYLQGQVSTRIAVSIGNRLYQQSLTKLTKKRIAWFAQEYSVKIADRFNHDYEEIFIAVHGLLGIYKNIIIFIATIEFISTNRKNIVIIMIFLTAIYFSVFKIIRNVQKKVIKNYYDYKYSYVRVLQESVRGADVYRIFNIKKEIMNRTQQKYLHLAAYKLAQSYTLYAISILTDIISIILLGSAIYYGLEMKQAHKQSSIAIIATSITLLVNLSEVLKTIIKESLNFGTFFAINIMPFLQIMDLDTDYKKSNVRDDLPLIDNLRFSQLKSKTYNIAFNKISLREPSFVSLQPPPFSLTIEQGQRILLLQEDDQSRNLLLYSLTRNLPMLVEPQLFTSGNSSITIGGEDIREIEPLYLRQQVGVILSNNFYFSGTLKENISWRRKFNAKLAHELVVEFGLDNDLEDYAQKGFKTKLDFESNQLNPSITKKIALLRVILKQPKIIILKDTLSFIQSISIIEAIDAHLPYRPTIIKISNSIQSSFDIDRVIYMQKLQIIQHGKRNELQENLKSPLGMKLKDINLQGYLYANRATSLGKKKRTKQFFSFEFDKPKHGKQKQKIH